jgi:hypothetical protein
MILKDVTVVCIDTYNVGEAIIALRKTLQEVQPDKALFFTNTDVEVDGVETIVVNEINSVDDYSRFVIKELYKYITTEFVLIIQHDGYVLNGKLFDESLYRYDYCGALWSERDGLNNGNGGFSWRSFRLLETIGIDDTIEILTPEDVSICRIYRRYLEEKYAFFWAPDEVAERFSFELIKPKNNTFGFHGFHHKPYRPVVVIQRMGAMGDVIGVEPVLAHYHNAGYEVVLRTTPVFYELFYRHHFPVVFYENFDTSIPHKYFNLDMSYESFPKELHLSSYFYFAGVKNAKLKAPSLYYPDVKNNKLFKKYIVIHNDTREQPYRNIRNFNFKELVHWLKSKGYLVIQVGTTQETIYGAFQISTKSLDFLKYVVGGADYFIGIDSGISHIAVAFGVTSFIFSGSVDLNLIHPDMSNIHWINKKSCDTPLCWHDVVGCEGKKCVVSENEPPCSDFSYVDIFNIINKIK